MASLFKDVRTGVFVVEFSDRTRSPRSKRASTSVREIRSAERLRRYWEAEYAEGRYDPWTDAPPVPGTRGRGEAQRATVTLADARERFLESRSHKAANTVANHERVSRWFAVNAGSHRPVAEITARDIEAWLATLTIKPVTRANYVRHLRTLFRYCVAEAIIATDPTEAVRLERVPRHFAKALRMEEIERVAVYAETHCLDGAVRSSAWAAPFIRLGAETAMRRNELLYLRWEHVDLDAGHLTIACTEAFTTKSGRERRIPLSTKATDLLVRLRRERPCTTGLVIEAAGKPVAPHTCSDVVARFASRSGVPALTPHVLRHSCIMRLIEQGISVPVVQRFAGHADVTTTMRYCSVATEVYADQIRAALL
jgi:integrase